jgi:hypothetical protein
MQAITLAPTVADVEISASRPCTSAGKCRDESLLFGRARAQLFCLEPLALPALCPGRTNQRRLGAAN